VDPPRTRREARGRVSNPDDLLDKDARRGRWAALVRCQRGRSETTRGRLRGQNPQGRETGRSPGRAAHEVELAINTTTGKALGLTIHRRCYCELIRSFSATGCPTSRFSGRSAAESADRLARGLHEARSLSEVQRSCDTMAEIHHELKINASPER